MEFQYLDGGNSEVQDMQAEAYLYASSGTTGIAATGVIEGLVVTQTSTASGSVLIGAGACINQASLGQGASRLINPSQKTLDIFTANPVGGLPRNDIVVFDSVTKLIAVIVGTPNATPTDPTVPATSVALARLRHAASATTIPTAKIDALIVATTLRGIPAPTPTLTYTGSNIPAFATGITNFVFGGGNTLAGAVTFPGGRFTSAPIVTAIVGATAYKAAVRQTVAPTTAGVTLTVWSTDSGAMSATIPVHWIAIQE
jgi:hypothetical protein